MKVHIVNHMNGGMRVHRAGCRDVRSDLRRANSDWQLDVPAGDDVAEVVAADISEGFGWPSAYDAGEPAPWRAEHITVLPCCGRSAR